MDKGARKNVGRWNPVNSQLTHLCKNVTLFTATGPLSSQNKVLVRRQVAELNCSNLIALFFPYTFMNGGA